MIYTPLIKKALNICYEAHKDKYDKGGTPYVFHPYHLAEQMETEPEIIVALLHDVVEDGNVTFDDLKEEGFSDEVIDAINALTRRKNTTYEAYITHVLMNNLAVKIKKADLLHNMDTTRINKKSENRAMLARYQIAYDRLNTEGPITIKIKMPVKQRSLALRTHGKECFDNQIVVDNLNRPLIIIFPEWVQFITYGYIEGLISTWLKKYSKEEIVDKVTFLVDKKPKSDVPRDIVKNILSIDNQDKV